MKTFDLTVSRTIHGSAEEVFDVWLDPKSPGGLWFGVERAITMAASSDLDRGRTIEHTWVSEATRGLETVVTITLAPRKNGTEVTPIMPTCPTTTWDAGTRTDGPGI